MKPYQGISAYLSFVVLPFIVSGLIKKPRGVCQTPQGFCRFRDSPGTDQPRGAGAKKQHPRRSAQLSPL